MEGQKVWWVFGGDNYYPSGGMDDFVESFRTEEEALDEIERLNAKKGCCDWYSAVDISKNL